MTDLISRRSQRMSGVVTTFTPVRALGLSTSFITCGKATSDEIISLGKLNMRSATPRVTCM